MVYGRKTNAAGDSPRSSISPDQPPPSAVILSPCAACKILRRRCGEKCVLAPYFPPTDPLKFAIAHRVFGASNIIKCLQELPEDQRADAVNSMVYEANARVRDPIYGCTGTICHLQNQIGELQAELAKAHAEIFNMQCQNSKLFEFISIRNVPENSPQAEMQQLPSFDENSSSNFFTDEANLELSNWETLWT
ncbi:hypothetical protein ACP275_06G178900 [Erythranthe tilingii]